MLSSVSGQSEQWAHLTAYQARSGTSLVRDNGPAAAIGGGSAANIDAVSPIAGSTMPALTSHMNFMLMMLGGGTGPAGNSNLPVQAAGAPSGTDARNRTGNGAQQRPDSLLSALGGNASPNRATSGDAPQTVAVEAAPQHMKAVDAELGAVAMADAGMASAGAVPNGQGKSNQNAAPAEPDWRRGWDGGPGAGEGLQQQAALAAYSTANRDGSYGAPTPALQAIFA